MDEKTFDSTIPNKDLSKQQLLTQQILGLPLKPNQINLVESYVSGALYDFPGNERAAFLAAKRNLYHLEPEEMKEFESYSFFPEEHPTRTKFIRERQIIKIGDHTIEILNLNPNINLDHDHIRSITKVISMIHNLSPQFSNYLLKIFIILRKDTDSEDYGKNGYVTRRQSDVTPEGLHLNRGIVLTQEGYRSDLGHRIPGVNNLEGTIVHEFGHILHSFNQELTDLFTEALGYHRIEDTQGVWTDGWTKIHDPEKEEILFTHKKTGLKSKSGYVVQDLSKLPSSYACFNLSEDICESFVAWLFGKPLDDTRKKIFDDFFSTPNPQGSRAYIPFNNPHFN